MRQHLFKTNTKDTSIENIIEEITKKTSNVLSIPKDKEGNGGNHFGYWMQTLADVQFLDMELSGLSENYKIDTIKHQVYFNNNKNNKDTDFIKDRIAHLDTVNGEGTLYSELTDLFGDTNAYAFHNLYPYKGKFYPRIVRAIANAFRLNKKHLVLDPYNGCGTTTHECGIMGIKSIGIDINPIGNIIASLKNELPSCNENMFCLSDKQILDIYTSLKEKTISLRKTKNVLYKLLLLIYFDTVDAFVRTTRYNKKGELGLFIEKFNYIKDCHLKFRQFLKNKNLHYQKSNLIEGNVLDLKKSGIEDDSIDAIITSPPYYFSLDYVGKDKIAYDYLNDIRFFNYSMNDVKNEYLGMKTKKDVLAKRLLEKRVITYFMDLDTSIREMARVLKREGKVAIVIGDSSLEGNKLPTTQKTHQSCLKYGLKHIRTIFNPLLGTRNRAIRGESVLLYVK